MTNIILHGILGKRFGEEHQYNIGKPIDALRALMANKKGFTKAVKTWGRKGRLYEIICDGKLMDNELELNSTKKINTIEIVPIILGSSGVVKMIIGVILIIVGVILLPYGGIGKFFISVGVSFVLGGLIEILFPTQIPSFHTEATARSFTFSSAENSTTRGNPVQLGYGRLRIGSQVVSTVLEPARLGSDDGLLTGPSPNYIRGWSSSYEWEQAEER
jgi:predicted phage tail protein